MTKCGSNSCGGFQPPKGHLDTQMFPECEGTETDRNIVKKTVDKRKKKKKAFNLQYHMVRMALSGSDFEGTIMDNKGNIYKPSDIKKDSAVIKAIKNDWNDLKASLGESWDDMIQRFATEYPKAYEILMEVMDEMKPRNRKITEIERLYRNTKKWIQYNFGLGPYQQ